MRDQQLEENVNSTAANHIMGINSLIELINIPDEEMINYHYLWWTYNNNKVNITLFCETTEENNCSENRAIFRLALSDVHFGIVNSIKNSPEKGKLIEDFITEPPCKNDSIVQKFKIKLICDLHTNISHNKNIFLKLMLYTKQSPIYMDSEKEKSLFQKANETFNAKGYVYVKNEVKHAH